MKTEHILEFHRNKFEELMINQGDFNEGELSRSALGYKNELVQMAFYGYMLKVKEDLKLIGIKVEGMKSC